MIYITWKMQLDNEVLKRKKKCLARKRIIVTQNGSYIWASNKSINDHILWYNKLKVVTCNIALMLFTNLTWDLSTN